MILPPRAGPRPGRSAAWLGAQRVLEWMVRSPILPCCVLAVWLGRLLSPGSHNAELSARHTVGPQNDLACWRFAPALRELPCPRETEAEPRQGPRQAWDGEPGSLRHGSTCFPACPGRDLGCTRHTLPGGVSPRSALSTRSSPPWKGGDPTGQCRSRTSLCPCAHQDLRPLRAEPKHPLQPGRELPVGRRNLPSQI